MSINISRISSSLLKTTTAAAALRRMFSSPAARARSASSAVESVVPSRDVLLSAAPRATTLAAHSSTSFEEDGIPLLAKSEDDEEDVVADTGGLVDPDLLESYSPTLPPTFNFAAYANDSPLIQKFVHLGVRLYQWERMTGVLEMVLKLDFEKDVEPRLRFLVDLGIPPDRLNRFLTTNPYILNEAMPNLEKRVSYLQTKKFKPEAISMILDECPKWLTFSVPNIDRHLGFFQRVFLLPGNSIRTVATSAPSIILAPFEHIRAVNFKVKDEMGFEPEEIRELIVREPKIWELAPPTLLRRFTLLHNEFNFTHDELFRSPKLLLKRENFLRERLLYLRKIGRAQFNPEKPNYVSAEMLSTGKDSDFAINVAKTSVQEFNAFLREL